MNHDDNRMITLLITEWMWNSEQKGMKSQYFHGCCCLEDCGLCGGGTTLFNLMRRDRKEGGVILCLQLLNPLFL